MSLIKVVEPRVKPYTRRAHEEVHEGINNTLLVLGTDRAAPGPAGPGDGLGHSKAADGGKKTGTMFMVVGRKQSDPDIANDDAVFYISMKTAADKNLGIENIEKAAEPGPTAILRSKNVRVGYRSLKLFFEHDDNKKYVYADDSKTVVSMAEDSKLTVKGDEVEVTLGANTLKLTKGGELTVVASGKATITTSMLQVNGPLNVTGPISAPSVVATGPVTAGGLVAPTVMVAGVELGTKLKTHIHPVAGVAPGGGSVITGIPR